MIIPNRYVHKRVPTRVFECLATNFPNAKLPPVFSINLMILPIKPQTMISQPVFSSIITVERPWLKADKKFPLSAKIKHIIVARSKASKIRFVAKM